MTKKLLILSCICILVSIQRSFAQMPTDAIYMNKNSVCSALVIGNSSWTNYWENALKRDNQNLGKVSTQSIMPMVAVGVSDKLNIIAALPYIATKTSAGNLLGQKGIQDLSLWAKYNFLKSGALTLHALGGVSVPMSKYVPSFLPLSIGLQCKTATARIMADYNHKSGMYVTAFASFIARSKIKIDQDSYLTGNTYINSNQVAMPNATDVSARIGYLEGNNQIEVFIEKWGCTSGDFIRRNDMPFPTNNMQMTSVGAYGKYQPKDFGVNFRYSYVVSGKNVGQSTALSLGLIYQINNIKIKRLAIGNKL